MKPDRSSSQQPVRVGIGYDIHRLVEGRRLVLGGVHIEHSKGLAGHSDADVLAHAVSDAVLGAAGLGDLGTLFPDTDPQWQGASSLDLLLTVVDKLHHNTMRVRNVDATVIAEAPRLAPHIEAMRLRLAGALGVEPAAVSVKATTNERLGEIGRGEAIAAVAVALVERGA